ncbi:MAG: NAD(P)-dependent oxidoreductase [Oenococcus sp.]
MIKQKFTSAQEKVGIKMKLIAYHVSSEENKYVQEWSKINKIEVDVCNDFLTPETVTKAKNYDGISALQKVPYSAELFLNMQTFGIQYLSLRNVGTDNINTTVAQKAKIHIANVPTFSPNSIAEFAVLLAMSLIRKMGFVNHANNNGDFHKDPSFEGRELKTLTVGVIGAGHIGKEVVRICKGLGMKVLIYDSLSHSQSSSDKQEQYVTNLNRLYAQSDIITLHVPGVAKNYHLLNKDTFAKMQKHPYIINTARGNLINTKDLISALESGVLAGAGLDTYENENHIFEDQKSGKAISDPEFQQLTKMPNVILTPHIAFYTESAIANMVKFSLDNLKEFVESGHSNNEIF